MLRAICHLVTVLPLLAAVAIQAKSYPNEIVDTPIVTCEPTKVTIKVKTSHSNPSNIYAEDFHDSPKCVVRNMNKLSIPHGECGMTTEHMDNPGGTMYRICVVVQVHPLFVTDSDRSYCAQCVYMEANVVDDLEKSINIRFSSDPNRGGGDGVPISSSGKQGRISEMIPSELEPQFDEASNPHCSYSIRKGSVDGPEIHAAVVGEAVFHVWQCDNENVGILVQNCHVEDLQGDKILIVDQNGCGIDQYLFQTPHYTNDLHTAYLESNVFKFVDKSMTRFRCQLRLCVKNRGQGCESVTPPNSCPNVEDEGVVSRSPTSTSGTSSATSSASTMPVSVNRPTPPPSTRVLLGNTVPPSMMKSLNNGEGGSLSTPVNANVFRPPPMVVANSGSPPSTGFANAGNSPSGSIPRTIGPPSIRPFGLSTAHIVSGKGSANAAALVVNSKHHRAGTNSSSTTTSSTSSPSSAPPFSSPSISVVGSSHQSGYRYRRSTMIYGTAIRQGPTPPGRVHKREANETHVPQHGADPNTTHPITITASTQRPPVVRRKLPELDVVGLIRVLDNPDDIGADHYYPDPNNNQHHRRLVTAGKHSPQPVSNSPGSPPAAPQSLPQPLANQSVTAPNKQQLNSLPTHAMPQALSNTVDSGETHLGDTDAKCLPRNTYYTLVAALALLSTIQLVGITFLLIDRFILGKAASKRIYNFVRQH